VYTQTYRRIEGNDIDMLRTAATSVGAHVSLAPPDVVIVTGSTLAAVHAVVHTGLWFGFLEVPADAIGWALA